MESTAAEVVDATGPPVHGGGAVINSKARDMPNFCLIGFAIILTCLFSKALKLRSPTLADSRTPVRHPTHSLPLQQTQANGACQDCPAVLQWLSPDSVVSLPSLLHFLGLAKQSTPSSEVSAVGTAHLEQVGSHIYDPVSAYMRICEAEARRQIEGCLVFPLAGTLPRPCPA